MQTLMTKRVLKILPQRNRVENVAYQRLSVSEVSDKKTELTPPKTDKTNPVTCTPSIGKQIAD